MYSKKLFFAMLIFLAIMPAFSKELTFKLTGNLVLPFLTSQDGRYGSVGVSGNLQGGIILFDFLNVGPEFSYMMLPKFNSSELPDGASKFVNFIGGGVHFGALLYPASRIELELGGALGPYFAVSGQYEHSAPWYKAFMDVAFRLTPNWTLGAEASWIDYQYDTYWGQPGAAGVSVGIALRYKFDTEKSLQNVTADIAQDDNVFPLTYSLYKEAPFATITLKNNETAEIRNVKVSFRAGKYTGSEHECGRVAIIKKRRTSQIDLSADFSKEILNFTEEGKIPGEIVVEYELLGQKRKSVSQVIIPVYNRNQFRWTDPNVLASFISPTAPEILEYSKVLVGLARSHQRSGLNRNLQYAIYVYEGMRLSGIACKEDETTPYNDMHQDYDAVDYVQYPYQTMMYKAGDKDDIGVLFMSLLQSTGIDAAFIPTPEDFIVAINLKLDWAKSASMFDGKDRILNINDEVWIPISMSLIKEGFMNSWYQAVDVLNEMQQNGEEIEFYSINEAWQTYPSVGFSSGDDINILPRESSLILAAETNLSRYITAEFGPQISALQERLKREGITVKHLNQLGMLYLRAGMYSNAISIYERSAQMGSLTALVNLGNIAVIQKRFMDAKELFERVLAQDPKNKTAKTNLERIMREFDK
ncbi:MAG: hypothetical protein IKP49_07770 [Treponema sp.]|nr:hypothetical protein [Treponema sp.]